MMANSSPGNSGTRGRQNTLLGMFIFIGAELMFFGGLIGAFLLFRYSGATWPPSAQPRLPVFVTGINTAVLLASGYTMKLAWAAASERKQGALWRRLVVTSLLGIIFLTVQGYEWLRLLGFGLTLSSSIYGAIFYILIGAHGLHVTAAVIWLFFMMKKAADVDIETAGLNVFRACSIYWYFVVLLWPLLYALVYLA